MGWRDINMNRRKPQLRVAVVPVEEGEELEQAVLRKAAAAAVSALGQCAVPKGALSAFAAGYLAGYARQQALKHGVEPEGDGMECLLPVLAREAPETLRDAIAELRFAARAVSGLPPRARLRAAPGLADAGYIVGQVESLCGTRRLLKAATEQAAAGDVDAFLTACDVAADRLQTHQPTLSVRLDPAERAAVREAFGAFIRS
jgi:hypothetical protein